MLGKTVFSMICFIFICWLNYTNLIAHIFHFFSFNFFIWKSLGLSLDRQLCMKIKPPNISIFFHRILNPLPHTINLQQMTLKNILSKILKISIKESLIIKIVKNIVAKGEIAHCCKGVRKCL